jgi:hypothetical protein
MHFQPSKRWHTPCFIVMAKLNTRKPATPLKTFDPRLDQLEGDAAEVFEIDRSNLVLQLRTLRYSIDEGALEMEMVASERVFGKSVSGALTRGGQKLRLAARDLHRILRLLERTRAPKGPGRPDKKPKPRNRRKAR